MQDKINVTVWNEFVHEKKDEAVRKIYPNGIHTAIADFLGKDGRFSVRTATLDQEENGLPESILEKTDVLVWWGHMAHEKLADEVALRVKRRVLEGMGLIVLHSAHFSKPFKLLMGTNCSLKWREADEKARLWVIEPGHPIAAGLGEYFELPGEEMYGERFDIPQPDTTVFITWFEGGNVFRSGCCWDRGNGRVFYFQPGHETYPTYYEPNVRKVITNAVAWAAPRVNIKDDCPNAKVPLEPIQKRDLSAYRAIANKG
jgi:trehalose utilization protein